MVAQSLETLDSSDYRCRGDLERYAEHLLKDEEGIILEGEYAENAAESLEALDRTVEELEDGSYYIGVVWN